MEFLEDILPSATGVRELEAVNTWGKKEATRGPDSAELTKAVVRILSHVAPTLHVAIHPVRNLYVSPLHLQLLESTDHSRCIVIKSKPFTRACGAVLCGSCPPSLLVTLQARFA